MLNYSTGIPFLSSNFTTTVGKAVDREIIMTVMRVEFSRTDVDRIIYESVRNLFENVD